MADCNSDVFVETDIFAIVNSALTAMATVVPGTGVVIPGPYTLVANNTITLVPGITLSSPVPGIHIFSYNLTITNTGIAPADFFVGASVNGSGITNSTLFGTIAPAATLTSSGTFVLNLPSPTPNIVQIEIATSVATAMNTTINQWALVKN